MKPDQDYSAESDIGAAIDLEAFRAWLDSRNVGAGDLTGIELLTGGTQNILMRFCRGGECWILRRPPRHMRANSNETMRREARILSALSDTTVPHPRLVAACDDETILGVAFYLMEAVDGFNATTGLPPLHAASEDVRHRMGLSLVDGIAGLSLYDYRELGLEGFGKPLGFLERQVGRWARQFDDYRKISEWTGYKELRGFDLITRWLESNIPSDFQPGILHGDYHLANALFSYAGPELHAIVDWELSTIGDPLLDLGWLIATWPEEDEPVTTGFDIQPWRGFPSISKLVERYAGRTGRDMTSLPWFMVLACYKLGIILEGTYARSSAGKAPVGIGKLLHGRAIGLFDRAVRQIQAPEISA